MEPERTLTPNHRISTKERKVFDRVATEFPHLKQSDADMLARFAEASVRYATAAKDVKARPMVDKPTINRSTGNVTGSTPIRNPHWRTVAEAEAQMNSLARRLLIDAASETKRLQLQTKKARSLAAIEEDNRGLNLSLDEMTPEQIAAMNQYDPELEYIFGPKV